jgi:hypothetical protein
MREHAGMLERESAPPGFTDLVQLLLSLTPGTCLPY